MTFLFKAAAFPAPDPVGALGTTHKSLGNSCSIKVYFQA
jgi:hypothetical protein